MRTEAARRAPPILTGTQPGRFIAVIGPSGVGKDSVMAGLSARHPALLRVRRAITRPPEPDGEDHEALSPEAFRQRAESGGFILSWQAHGLCYGIPASVASRIAEGTDVLANLSRAAVAEAASRFDRVELLSLSADPQVLAARLAGRGRETAEQIAVRLARRTDALPPGLRCHEIRNNGSLEEAVAAASRALYPESG